MSIWDREYCEDCARYKELLDENLELQIEEIKNQLIDEENKELIKDYRNKIEELESFIEERNLLKKDLGFGKK